MRALVFGVYRAPQFLETPVQSKVLSRGEEAAGLQTGPCSSPPFGAGFREPRLGIQGESSKGCLSHGMH